jgi:hypothetical protein
MTRSVLILTLPLALAACSEVDITGIYKTTSAARDTGTCEATTATTTPTYFAIREGELLGLTLLTIKACTAANIDSCSRGGTISETPLTLSTGDGWEGQADAAAGFSGQPCTFARTQIVATQADDLSLTVVASRREEARMTDSCEADSVPDDLPCVAAQKVVGDRVGDAPPNDGTLNL